MLHLHLVCSLPLLSPSHVPSSLPPILFPPHSPSQELKAKKEAEAKELATKDAFEELKKLAAKGSEGAAPAVNGSAAVDAKVRGGKSW